MKNRSSKATLSLSIAFGLCFGRSSGGAAFISSSCGCSGSGGDYAMRTTNDASGSSTSIQHRRRWRQDQCLNMIGTKKQPNLSVKDRVMERYPHQPDNDKPKIKFDLLPDFLQKDPLMVTKQKWREKSMYSDIYEDAFSSSVPKRQKSEMMIMSAVSVALAISVVYALASSGPAPDMIDTTEFNESGNVVREFLQEGNAERLEIATRNIVKTVLPQSAEDVIAVSIGEGIAGAIGAFATWLLGMILNMMPMNNDMIKTSGFESTKRNVGSSGGGGQMIFRPSANNMDALMSEAVADGDYFLTRAAAQPLLEAVGIPIFFASLASILIATLPYEAVKLTSQKRKRETEEQRLLEMLLEEEESRRRDINVIDVGSNKISEFIQRLSVRQPTANVDIVEEIADTKDYMNKLQQQRLVGNVVPGLDYVELFADITKWLEYDVLISNYRGILTMPTGQMLTTSEESAIFGLLAAFSSQLYTDVLYLYSDFGNPLKREQTINRSLEGWASIYATKCISTATLFGVYEGVRAPISRVLSQLLSGGVGGCVGSNDFDLCMETYLIDNPASASLQADIRAAVVAALNSLDSFSWLLPFNN
ncbi:hypothetical protein ACHAWU_005414 [Discostella pseudostelligera]|uniref:Uncharacterized protein n=1 Tax=Discostella pseudostelligera TaxID=259834 RepID=A0ABD3LZB6_9STRA